jgi:hypothetical protein
MSADGDFHAKIGPTPADPGPSELERLVREWRVAADAWDHEPLTLAARIEDMSVYRRAYMDAERALRLYARQHLP